MLNLYSISMNVIISLFSEWKPNEIYTMQPLSQYTSLPSEPASNIDFNICLPHKKSYKCYNIPWK